MDEQFSKQVSELIERFERNETSYTSGQYNEAQLRQEFINPVRTYHHFAPGNLERHLECNAISQRSSTTCSNGVNPFFESLGWDEVFILNRQLPSAKTDHGKTALQRQIDATDKRIDELVYDLFRIEEEIIDG